MRNRSKYFKFLRHVRQFAAAILLASCGGGGGEPVRPRPTPVAPTTVVVAPATTTIPGVGQTATLTATVSTNGVPVATPVVTWQTSDAAVATVGGSGASGTVTGVAAGTVTISATSGAGSGSATVTVTASPPVVTSVTVAPATLALVVPGANEQLTATVNTAVGAQPTPVVVWSSSAPTVASVTGAGATGTVIPVGVGSTTITATSGGRSGTAAVTVTAPVQGSSVTIDLRACQDSDGWLAMQADPAAPWVRVTGSGGRFSFAAAGNRVGIAYASDFGRGLWTSVIYAPASEVERIPARQLCDVSIVNFASPPDSVKQVLVSVAGIDVQDDLVYAVTGGESTAPLVTGSNPLFVPRGGVHDILGIAFDGDTARAIVRRDVDFALLPAGSLLAPPFDFRVTSSIRLERTALRVLDRPAGGTLGFQPFTAFGAGCFFAPQPATNSDLSNSLVYFSSRVVGEIASRPHWFFTIPRGTTSPFELQRLAPPTDPSVQTTGFWLPPTSLRPNELHGAVLHWSDGTTETGESRSLVETNNRSFGEYSLPSALPNIAPQILPGERYRRFRVQFVLPQDLRDGAVATFASTTNQTTLSLRVHRSLLNGGAVDLTTPDFTSTEGWQDMFGPIGTVRFDIHGEGNSRTNACTPGRTVLSTRFGIS